MLRAGLRILDRGTDGVQVGADPRWATVLPEVSPDAATTLRAMVRQDGPASARRTRATPRDAPADLRAALASLARSGLLVPEGATVDVPSGRTDDRAAIDHVTQGRGGLTALERRAAATVAVIGLGRLGMVLAGTLAAAGVGTLLLDDGRRVRPADVGVGGLREHHVGRARARAAAEVLVESSRSTRIGTERDVPDVVALVFDEVADPIATARLVAEGVPHLAVVVREGDVVVGPFVVPGLTPCLHCLDLHRADHDARWPELAAQLRAAARDVPAAQESCVAGVAGALAAAHVLAGLDGHVPPTRGETVEMSLPDALPRVRSWTPHPGCGCGAGHPSPAASRSPAASARAEV